MSMMKGTFLCCLNIRNVFGCFYDSIQPFDLLNIYTPQKVLNDSKIMKSKDFFIKFSDNAYFLIANN